MIALVRRDRWTAVAIPVLALLAWPFDTLTPGVDGDWHWVAGLAMLAKEGHAFGDELIWNYGPLGFLNLIPLLHYGDVAAIAFAYQWALQILLAGTVYVAARRSYPAPLAFAVAFVAIALVQDRALMLGFALCVLALTRPDDTARDALARWFPAAIGVLAGILVLSKLNQGVEIVALATVALVARPARRAVDAATFAGGFAAAAAAGWLITGQALDDVWPYVRYGAETIGGYPANAGASDADGQWRYLAALLVFVLGSALVWNAARGAALARRWGLVAVWLLFSFAAFKQGFVRHDAAHVALYMTSMLVAFAVLPVKPIARWRALAGTGIIGCVVLYAVIGQDVRLHDRLDPYANAKSAVSQARTLASRAERTRQRRDLAQAIRDHYGLPQETVEEIGDRPVAFWPFSTGDLAYALGVDWRSWPIIEPYGISTPALDDVTVEMLDSSRAPARIVRRARQPNDSGVSLDPPPSELLLQAPFEPPLTTRAVFCRYRELSRREGWQLLARGQRRCGEPRTLETVVAPWGEPVALPEARPGTGIVVEIDGADVKGRERLKALWLRPDARMIVLDGRPYRLVPSTAPNGHLLRAAPEVDYQPPFNMAPNPSRIAVQRIGDQPSGELRYSFLELPVYRPPA